MSPATLPFFLFPVVVCLKPVAEQKVENTLYLIRVFPLQFGT